MIEEAKDKAFDAVALDTTKTISMMLQIFQLLLGKEGGEVYPDFDDFDDYNNLLHIDSLSLRNPQTGAPTNFEIRSKVEYVSDANPDVKSGSKTYHKKMTVSVFSYSYDGYC